MPDQITPSRPGTGPAGEYTDTGTGYYNATTRSTKTCTLTVKYYANGGVGDPPPATSQTYKGPKVPVEFEETVKDNETFMTKDNNWFCGWATSSDGRVRYVPGDVITATWTKSAEGTSRTNLYAKWQSNQLYIYHPDENTIEEHYTWSSKVSGTQTTLKGAVFTRVGYTQVGWASEPGGEKVYDLEQTITPSSSSIEVLYPFWEANTYTITFHANGGVGEDTTMSVVYDATVEIPSTEFTKTGYHQDCWNEAEDGSDASWFQGWTYIFKRDEDVDLYVIWAGDEYTVYYTDDAPNSTNYIHTSKAIYGSPFYTDRIEYPRDKSYYTFDGWIADDNTVLTKQTEWFDAYSYGSDPTWTLQRDLVIRPRWSPHYPFGKILFAGAYSNDFGIYVEEHPAYQWPEYSYDHHKAFGKNGDILSDPKRYNNVERTYKISAYDNVDYYSVAKKVSEWLHRTRSDKYLRLEDSYEPDVYRLAVYEESATLENLLATAGKCEITFNCKPQKFLLNGEKKINILSSGQFITNPTGHASKPLIKCYGSGTIYINDSKIEILKSFNDLSFDAESYDAYDSAGRNMNRFVYTEDRIELKPGSNTISYEGTIFNVSIIPRWWTV